MWRSRAELLVIITRYSFSHLYECRREVWPCSQKIRQWPTLAKAIPTSSIIQRQEKSSTERQKPNGYNTHTESRAGRSISFPDAPNNVASYYLTCGQSLWPIHAATKFTSGHEPVNTTLSLTSFIWKSFPVDFFFSNQKSKQNRSFKALKSRKRKSA